MNPYYEQIVVGSSLRALLFASLNGLPVFFSEPEQPFEFDYFEPSDDLSAFRIENKTKSWVSPKGEIITGIQKLDLWEHLLFILGLKGLAPFSDFCTSLRIIDNTLTGFSDYAKLKSIDFGVCHYFDENATYNLLPCERKQKNYRVYDRLAFVRGGKHKYDVIDFEQEFIKRVWFYLSHRIDGRKPIKDACALSILSEDQIDDFDFSETIVRIKTVEAMKTLGLRGPRNGYQYDGSIRYRSFKVEALERTKFLTETPSWIEEENIKVPKITEQELLSHLPEIAEKHIRILETIWQNT
jgi:hypothetical protein